MKKEMIYLGHKTQQYHTQNETRLAAANARLRGLAAAQKAIGEMVEEARLACEEPKSQGRPRMFWEGRFDGLVCAEAMLALADYPTMRDNAESIKKILKEKGKSK